MAEQPAVTFYREGDADPDGLSGQTIAVVGYGNLGRSMALNLRDSGLTVTVGNVDDDYRATAQADGFEVSGVGEAVATADVVYVLIPDEVIPEVFRDEVAPRLRSGACVCFASGYVVATGWSSPPTASTCCCWRRVCSARRSAGPTWTGAGSCRTCRSSGTPPARPRPACSGSRARPGRCAAAPWS